MRVEMHILGPDGQHTKQSVIREKRNLFKFKARKNHSQAASNNNFLSVHLHKGSGLYRIQSLNPKHPIFTNDHWTYDSFVEVGNEFFCRKHRFVIKPMTQMNSKSSKPADLVALDDSNSQKKIKWIAKVWARKYQKTISSNAMRLIELKHWSHPVADIKKTVLHALVVMNPNEKMIRSNHLPFYTPSLNQLFSIKSDENWLNLETNEKRIITEALCAAHGNRTIAAKRLGIARSTLFEKIKKFSLSKKVLISQV